MFYMHGQKLDSHRRKRPMPNELDMDAYHTEGIDPGQHKIFNITPTVHTFNQRFEGEPGTLPTQVPGESFATEDIYKRRTDFVDRNFKMWPNDPNAGVGAGESTFQNMPYNPDKNTDDLNLYNPVAEDPISNKWKSMFGARGGEGGGSLPKNMPRNERFSEDLKTSIVGDKDAGMSYKDIAKKHGLREYQVRDYLAGRRYRNPELKEEPPDWFKEEMKQ